MAATCGDVRAFLAPLVVSNLPDFTIRCSAYHWRVHKRIVSASSSYFDQICNGSIKQPVENEITLHGENPWIIARMIQYFYFGWYSAQQEIVHGQTSSDDDEVGYYDGFHQPQLEDMMVSGRSNEGYLELKDADLDTFVEILHALVYKVADRYNIEDLRLQAKQNLMEHDLGMPGDIFFTVANIIGLEALHLQPDLLRYMVANVFDGLSSDSQEFQHFQDLLRRDPRILMVYDQLCVDGR